MIDIEEIKEFADFCRNQPEDTKFDFYDCGGCAFGQFVESKGYFYDASRSLAEKDASYGTYFHENGNKLKMTGDLADIILESHTDEDQRFIKFRDAADRLDKYVAGQSES